MTITPIRPQILTPFMPGLTGVGGSWPFPVNITLDSTADYWAPHFFCADAVTIDRFEWVMPSVSVAGNFVIQVYTLDTSGVPTTPVGNAVTVATGSAGRKVATGLAASCAADTLYCVRVAVDAGTNAVVRAAVNAANSAAYFSLPYGWSVNTAGSNSISTADFGLNCAVGPASGFSPTLNPAMHGALSSLAWQSVRSSGGGVVHAGNRWVPQAPLRVWGIYYAIFGGAVGGDTQVVLSNAGGAVLASGTLDASQVRSADAARIMVAFDTPFDVVAGTTYYLMVKGLDTTVSDVTELVYSSNDSLAAVMGTGTYKVTAATLGTYTEATDRFMMVLPIISGVEDGAGGPGGSTLVLNSRSTSHLRR